MNYKNILPNVNWNCPTHSNINILILCHPEQNDYYLPLLKKYIWAENSNVTIWQINSTSFDAVQALEEIALMDAVICIISELFISGHNMMAEYIMPELLSKENNILPLLMEKCVEKDFENKYGHIHYERWTGNTEQKKEKISKFLGTVKQKKSKQSYAFDMISESMINCFSQSFFISYRKIDGKYIDILRNKIHDDISLVDTQLWYDAYLMAGENYDASLRNVMDNCNAIILVVTPNLLLDSNNYVERVEVPYARKNGIPIIPILMEDANLKKIGERYGISKIYKLDDYSKFSDVLAEAGVPVQQVDSYPAHLYKLGLEYRDGKTVERNIKIACELFRQASEYGLSQAFERLIEIKTGEYEHHIIKAEEDARMSLSDSIFLDVIRESSGESDEDSMVKKCIEELRNVNCYESHEDFDEAISLFNKAIDVFEAEYEKTNTEKSLLTLLGFLRKCGEYLLEKNMLPEAYQQLSRMHEYVKDANSDTTPRLCTYLSVACLLLGKTFNMMEEYSKAETFYKKAMLLDMELFEDDYADPVKYGNSLISACELGNFYQQRGKLLNAKAVYTEVLDTIRDSGTVYGNEWDEQKVYIGYMDEESARKAEEARKYAMISLMEIERDLLLRGKYHPCLRTYPRDLITDSRILDICNDESISLISHDILLNTIPKLKWLYDYISKIDYEFDLRQDRYCMDAKSLTGIMSMDIMKPFELVIHTIDHEKAEKIMQEIVENVND